MAGFVTGTALCIAGVSLVVLPGIATSLSALALQLLMGAGLFVGGLIVARSGRKEDPCELYFDPESGEFYQQLPGAGPVDKRSSWVAAVDQLSLKPIWGCLHLENQQSKSALRLHVNARKLNQLVESFGRHDENNQ